MIRPRRSPGERALGRVLIEIDYATSPNGPVAIAYIPEGATDADKAYIHRWFEVMRRCPDSVDAFIPRPQPERKFTLEEIDEILREVSERIGRP